jgi:hypothetical protein
MREIRQSGSEGGGADQAALPTPIQQTVKYAARSKKYAAFSAKTKASIGDAEPLCS